MKIDLDPQHDIDKSSITLGINRKRDKNGKSCYGKRCDKYHSSGSSCYILSKTEKKIIGFEIYDGVNFEYLKKYSAFF